jgi:hypothetical protein
MTSVLHTATGAALRGGSRNKQQRASEKLMGAPIYLGISVSILSLTLANLGSARESVFCRVNGYGGEFCHCLGFAVTVKKLTQPIFRAWNDR